MMVPDFKIFKIGLLATSAVVAPIATILVQNEYAELNEEEEVELTAAEMEEIEKMAPTFKALSSIQEEAKAKRRARYKTLKECLEKIKSPTEKCMAAVREEMEEARSKYEIVGEDDELEEDETDEEIGTSQQKIVPTKSPSGWAQNNTLFEEEIAIGPQGTFTYYV